MSRSELLEKLKPIVANYAHNKEAVDTITEDTDFIKDLNINSANLVDVVLDIEEEFGIEIDNQSMEKMLTVSAALEIIEGKLLEKMVGIDIVDLAQAETDSNWRREGYLNKIFTPDEQARILEINSSSWVWLFWSMKESAYKIFSRIQQIRNFAPARISCYEVNLIGNVATGLVSYENNTFHTRSTVTDDYICSIAAETLSRLELIDIRVSLHSNNDYRNTNPASVSHHGRFLALAY